MTGTNREHLTAFFEAENRRDWETYRTFLHRDVVWTLHGKQTRTVSGIDAYLDAMREAYRDSGDTFVCQELYTGDSESRITAILVNNHGACSCDIFDFEDGLIVREYEFIL